MGKIIASLDIGIRNLAYCVMEYNPQGIAGNQFVIHDWNVLDLLSASEPYQKRKCETVYKSGKHCGQVCGQDVHDWDPTTQITLCHFHAKTVTDHQLTRVYMVKNISLYELARLAIQRLDQIDFGQCQEIIIESQPSKNPKMKNFSMILLNYLIIRYIVEKKEGAQILQEVKFINSRNKLTVYDGPYVECHLKEQHARNKYYGNVYCRYLIRNNPERVAFLTHFKKTDDLSDSFLQGAWYLLNSYRGSSSAIGYQPFPHHDNAFISDSETVSEPGTVLDPESSLIPSTSLVSTEEPTSGGPPPTHKIKIKLKQVPIGRDFLQMTKHSSTTRQTMVDYYKNQYRQLKKGYRPLPNASHYSLSNLKYILEHHQYDPQNHILLNSLHRFFGETNVEKLNLV
uniref:Mitochondrial resolvase Ydc2 catalytic domain-containing protein n=1 Tax=viral metagenome TaxID=1070528 RepID=A0A6C0BLZ8_9ZZZZ